MIVTTILPVAASLLAFVFGVELLFALKPGQVCSKNADCNNCELLFSLAIGSIVLSLVYFMLKLKWFLTGSYPVDCVGLDLYAWSSIGTAGFGLLAWLCYRGMACAKEFCDFIRLK